MNNAFANDPYAKAFDINVSGSMTKIEGRVLNPPTRVYKVFIDSFSGRIWTPLVVEKQDQTWAEFSSIDMGVHLYR